VVGPDPGRHRREEVGEQLETEGVDKFAASYQAMLDTIEAKRAQASR
jgi:hypothetical protein